MFWTGANATCPAGVKGREAALNQFFLRLQGLWEGIIQLARPPPPPDDEPDLDWFNRPRNSSNPDPEGFDQLVLRSLGEGVSPTWQPEEIQLDDGRTLVLEYSWRRLPNS